MQRFTLLSLPHVILLLLLFAANQISSADIKFRAGKPADATQLRALIQELANHHSMPKAPKLDAARIAADLRADKMRAVVAMDGEVLAGYAIYYLPISSDEKEHYAGFRQAFFLEDLYVRSDYRRMKLGAKLMQEVAKASAKLRIPYIEWDVARDNEGAIRFYRRLPGLEDMTNGKSGSPEQKIMWRISGDKFEKVSRKQIRETKTAKLTTEVKVFLDKPGNVGAESAMSLAKDWHRMIKLAYGDGRKQTTFDTTKLAKEFQNARLGAMTVKDKKGEPVGMAIFHRKAYSTWTGQFVVLEKMVVKEPKNCARIGLAIVAELVKLAKSQSAVRVQWMVPERGNPANFCQNAALFKSWYAVNLTEVEGWLIYRWHYRQKQQSQ